MTGILIRSGRKKALGITTRCHRSLHCMEDIIAINIFGIEIDDDLSICI